MTQIFVTQDLAARGSKVVRNPHWTWGDQDGGEGSVGEIIDENPPTSESGWVRVRWPNGLTHNYRVGVNGVYDLLLYIPSLTADTRTRADRLQEARAALGILKDKTDSITQKSNSNHDYRNTGKPIKVRRPISTIKGSKRRIYTPVTSRRG